MIGGTFILYAVAIYPVIGMLTGRFFPAAPLYVLVVLLVWLLAMTPPDAIAMGVAGKVARPIVAVVATAMLTWRDYRALTERLVGFALLLVAVVCLGHDERLMILGGIVLVATFVRWLLTQPHCQLGASRYAS